MDDVAIIILNWNGWKDTIECLKSLNNLNYKNYEVIVVDNGSTDNSVEKIKEYIENKPKFKLIANEKNLGFAGGNNIGIRYALNNEFEYILLLNNDTVVDENFLKPMVELLESSDDIGFVGPKTYFYDKKNLIQVAGGGYVDLTTARAYLLGYMENDSSKYNEVIELDYVSGSCILTKRDVIEEIGLLDERFFMYYEDVEWCYRGKKHGYKSFYQPEAVIWHKHGASTNKCFELYHLNKSRILFIKKTGMKNFIKFVFKFFSNVFWLESYYYIRKYPQAYKCYLKGLLEGFKG